MKVSRMSKEAILKNLNEIQELVNDDKKFKYKNIVNFNCEHIKEELEVIEKGKNTDIIDNYVGFKNDNANPSEALECLEALEQDIKDRVILAEDRQLKLCAIIKQALLKAQEPKKYLKWEDLEFKEKRQTIEVRMGNTIYNLFFYEFDTGYKRCHLCNEEETLIYDIQEQFFNDLHLERVLE